MMVGASEAAPGIVPDDTALAILSSASTPLTLPRGRG